MWEFALRVARGVLDVYIRAQTNVLPTHKFSLLFIVHVDVPQAKFWHQRLKASFSSFFLRKRISHGSININWMDLGCRNNLCKFINWGLFTSKQFVDEVSRDSGPSALRAETREGLSVILWCLGHTSAYRHTQFPFWWMAGDSGHRIAEQIDSASTIRSQLSHTVFFTEGEICIKICLFVVFFGKWDFCLWHVSYSVGSPLCPKLLNGLSWNLKEKWIILTGLMALADLRVFVFVVLSEPHAIEYAAYIQDPWRTLNSTAINWTLLLMFHYADPFYFQINHF